MNPVLDTLCCDHGNFGKLLNLIEEQADTVKAGCAPDLPLLDQVVAYLEGYPVEYHHPLEDAVYTRLRAVAPGCDSAIEEVTQQHGEIRRRLQHFKEHLARAKTESQLSRITFAAVAYAFLEAEWAHMELERTALFPAALKALSATDWVWLETQVPRFHDPLFGGSVDAPLERLHQRLLVVDSKERARHVLRRAS